MSEVERWQDLFDELTVEGYSFTVTDEQLNLFEDLLGFRLPKEFRAFCKVFGLGVFSGDEPLIYFDAAVLPIPELWPDEIASERHIRRSQFSYSWLKTSINCDYKSLEENSYIFAHADSSINCLWDLRTWNSEEESYLMYFFVGSTDFLKGIGYSFYDFVVRYCIGDNLIEDMVDWGCYEEKTTSDDLDSEPDNDDISEDVFSTPNCFVRPDETINEFRDSHSFPEELG